MPETDEQSNTKGQFISFFLEQEVKAKDTHLKKTVIIKI
jgi:hypothetical protein